MKKNRLFIIGFFAVVLIAAVGIPTKPQFYVQNGDVEVFMAGRNVNMVSGTTLPYGDPYLQRQNEPSLAVSSRNPLHLLAGANDYRTVDMPIPQEQLPGIEEMMAADAWLGYYTSDDGGESWKTALLPGFPQDTTDDGMNSPLKAYSTAADPWVRPGSKGRLYYSGLAFNRGGNGSAIFVARFEDTNDKEVSETIEYRGVKIVATGNAGQFVDMPRMAVDVPRGAGNDYVFLVYTMFLGNLDLNIKSKMYFTRSIDGGLTWSSPTKLSESQHVIQGASIAIDPLNGDVYVAFRRFYHKSQENGIVVVKSSDRGQTFSNPQEIATFPAASFDQPATPNEMLYPDPDDYVTGESIRTNSYPTIAVDDNHRVYVAWSQRNIGPAGAARIVMKSSVGGSSWSSLMDINPPGSVHQGHEFMPQMAFGAGKITLVWYDQRFDWTAHDVGFEYYIGDWITNIWGDVLRHTVDVWAAQFDITDYDDTTQWSYTQVSRYLHSLLVDDNGDVILYEGYPYIYPVQFNCLDYPMFKGGLLPFMGDYIALAASPTILNQNGQWVFNTEHSDNPIFHAAWTDNRDVRPPAGLFDWTDYTPADSAQDPIYVSPGRTNCSAGGNRPAIRNQNIYTAKLFWGIVAGSPANEKSLDLSVPRAFVVFVQNNTELFLRVRMSITEQPLNGEASFLQFDSLDELFITIAPYSTISRQVFLQSTDPNDSARIDIVEVDAGDIEIPGGMTGYVIINGDPSNGGVSGDEEHHQPQFSNPNIVNWVVNPNIVNPNIVNPNIVNPNIVNPNIVNPNIVNPNIVNEPINPNIVNPNIVNPNIVNPNIVNPNIVNPNIVNPNIVNPNIVNPNIVNAGLPEDIENVPVFDVMWTVTNEGNTATTYTLDTVADKAPPPGIYTQLLIYRVHKTPAIAGSVLSTSSPDYDECTLYEEPHHELILNLVNPNIVNPNIVNLGSVNPNIVNPNIVNESITNATFALGPGEEAVIDLRVLDTDGTTIGGNLISSQDEFSIQTFDLMEFIYSIGFVVTSMAVDSDDAAEGITIPKGAATDLYIVSSNPHDGLVGEPYNPYFTATMTAFGGTAPYNYTWSLNSGELPPGLSISTGTTPDPQTEGAPGIISGTPTTAGTYVFIVQVTDDNNPLHVDTQLFSITTFTGSIPDTPTITTTSLPSGVMNTWYGATIQVAGGDPPFTFSWTGAGTPTPEADGLMLDPVNGIITGTPSVATSYNFDVTVTDKDTQAHTVNLDLDILESTGNYFAISGTVYDDIGDPLGGVRLYGLPNSPITDAYGYYEDYVPEGWSGTVTPFKLNYSFTPENRLYVQVSSDQYGQDYNQQEWYATQSDVVRVTDMVVDSFGNAYVSGCGNTGAYVAKYDSSGTFQWDFRDGSSADDLFYGLCVDPDGYVYVTGKVNNDIKTVKLHPDSGLEQWSDVYDSGYINDEGLDIAIDVLGNVFVTGASATATLYMPDFITIKYDQSGTREWERIYDNGDIDRGHRVAIDSEGNIIAAGDSVDLVGGTGADLFIFKYDTLGNVIWTARYDNSFSLDAVEDLCLDSAGNVYVTGWTSTGENQADYLTVKYSNPGVFGWAATYDGASDQFDDWAYAITVDADGYVYVTGRSGENVCDPGPPVMICDDYATIKYDPSGNPVWTPGGDIDPYGAARYDGPPGVDHDVARDIEVDPLGNVYVTGRSVGIDGSFDFATLIYDSTGIKIWEERYGIVSRSDEAEEVELDPEGNIIVSGPSGDELLVLKYSQSFPTTLSITSETLPNGAVGLSYNTVLEAFGGTGSYSWDITTGALPDGLFLDGPTGLIFGSPTTAGTSNFTVEVTDGALMDSKPMSIAISVAAASQVELIGPGSVAASVVSGAFTLTSQNSVGVSTNVTADTVFALSSDTSGTATFYSDAAGNNVITQVTIANGTNSATFYYKDTAVGTPTVTASWASGGTDLGSDTHSISVSAPPTPTQVELTGPEKVGGGFISEAFTLTSQDIGGNPFNVTQDTVFDLSSDSSGISTFFSDQEGTSEIDQVTIPAGQSSVTFYYKDAVPATPTVTATWVSGDPGLGSVNLLTTVWAVVGQIAFASDRDGDYEIFIMNADGSGQIQVTDNNDADAYPSWSPQGSKIAFQSDRDGNNEIYIMNADGSGQTRLTDNSAQDNFPKLSPDGSKIVFTSSRDGNDDIFVMNADGSSPINLTNHPASDLHPSWSPDGTKISFMSTREGDSEIFVMDADGSNPVQLTFNTVGDAYSSWSPDGSKIAYANGSGTTCEIYIMNADGSNPTQLTDNSSFDSIPCWSPDGSRIVFLSYRDGHDQIYTMNADGSGQMNITNTPTKESWPNWGGAKIAFTNLRDGNREIYIMNADGTGQTRLTTNSAIDRDSNWSPDGDKIAFESTRDGNYEIYFMNVDGSGTTNLTANPAIDQNPSWSPDGSKIAFHSDRDGNDEIYVVAVDGLDLVRLTTNPSQELYPSWSPDGTKITFSSNRDTNHEIYVMNADGSAQTRLTDNSSNDLAPSWSPDGTKIAFMSFRDGNWEIYIMNADGSAQTRLTNQSGTEQTPNWSPDGRKITFTSDREGNYEIYVMNADGSNQTRLTNNAVEDAYPHWRPQARILASLVTNQVVLSGPASVEAGSVSGAFTLTSQNSLGMPTNVIDDTVFDLTSTSVGTVTYYSDSGGTDVITEVTIASGTNNVTFYYKDTELGDQTVTTTFSSGPYDLGASNHIISVTAGVAGQVELTGPAAVAAGAVSGAFTLESQDGGGNPSDVTADTVFNLTSDTLGTVTFYSDSGGTNEISPPQVTIANGTNNATFYYKDTAVGTPTVTAAWASGGTNLGSDNHQISVTAPPTVIISGTVNTGAGSGTGTMSIMTLEGVLMDGFPGPPVQTQPDGTYSAEVPYGWNGTVTPVKTDYIFEPISKAYVNVISNQLNQDYAGVEGWITRYHNDSATNLDMGMKIATDLSGNPYVTGMTDSSPSGLEDFDTITFKLDPNDGSIVWQTLFDRYQDNPMDIGVFRKAGVDDHIFVAAFPYSGSYDNDFVTLMYLGSTGGEDWRYIFDYSTVGDEDEVNSLAVDAWGDVYVTGMSDSDPDHYIRSWDYVTIKYDGDTGAELWIARYEGANDDIPLDIVVDALGNVYVTGYSNNGTDDDFRTIKYDRDGNEVWNHTYDSINGNDRGHDLALDPAGYLYVSGQMASSGTLQDFGVVKYDLDGNFVWATTYNNDLRDLDDIPEDMAIDGAGNIYVTGRSDIGGGVYDILTVKFIDQGATAAFGWRDIYDGPLGDTDSPAGIVIDPHNHIYVTGKSSNLDGFNDYVTLKYENTGPNSFNNMWTRRYDDENGNDNPHDIALCTFGNVYLTGESTGDGTEYDFATIKYTQYFDSLVIATTAFQEGVAGSPYAAFLDAFGGSGTRTWSQTLGTMPPGMDLDASTGIISGIPTTPGTYDFTIHVTDGVLSDTRSFSLTIQVPAAGTASQVELTGPGSVEAGTVSSALTLTSQDSLGTPVNVTDDTVFDLTSTSGGTFNFYSDSGGTDEISQVTIASGTTGITFYYKDTGIGSQTLTVTYSSGPVDLGSSDHIISVTAPSTPAEVNVKQDTTDIADGGGYDFSSQIIGSTTDVEFTIENLGGMDLSVTTPITVTGTDADQFSVHVQPDSTVSGLSDTTFRLRFSPTTAGAKSAAIAIGNNDADENPYDISLTGTAAQPDIFTRFATGNIATDLESSLACAWGDYDNDYDLDLFVANSGGQNNSLYTNNAGISFTKVTSGDIVSDGGTSDDCAWGDYDNDGDLDLFVANSDGENNFLYTNDGDGTFTKVTSGDIVSDGGNSEGCAWADIDGDNDLDLFVANAGGENNFLYTNDGDGTFTKVASGDIVSDGGDSFGCSFGDIDGDNDLDLFVTNMVNANNFLYTNDGAGNFTRVATGVIVSDGGNSMGCAWSDYDNDGDLDLFVTNYIQNNFLYTNDGAGSFTKVTSGAIVSDGGNSASCAWGDFDYDGDLDLFVANANQNNFLYTNNGDGTFAKVTSGEVVTDGGLSWGCAWADWEDDGDLDLFVTNSTDGNNFLYTNDGTSNNWRGVHCLGIISNFSAIGAKIKMLATINGDPVWQMREISGGGESQDSHRQEFGLGNATIIDELRIEWPSGKLNTWQDMSVNGYIVVTEPYTHEFLAQWGSQGSGDGEFDYPEGIAIDSSGNVYVADSGNNRIQKFNSDGGYVTQWGSSGNGNGEFVNPMGVAVDSSDNVYVADTDNNRIQKFNSSGGYITQWGSLGDGDSEFNYPESIAVDSSGNVYVADTMNHRIQKFNSSGSLLGWWGRDNSGWSGWHDPGSGRTGVIGTADGEFNYPRGIAVDNSDMVYVADADNHRIQKFTSDGSFNRKWGTQGSGDGEFDYPWDVACGSSGWVYVVDRSNNRIQKFTSLGGFRAKWGTQGSGDGQFEYPRGIAVGSQEVVYVVDTANNRIQKFSRQ